MRTRTRTLALGLGAMTVLIAVIAGTPWLLLHLAGSPVPSRMPDWSAVLDSLQRPDDGTLILGAFRVIAWLAWASFTGSVITQLAAQLRHVRAPRIPVFVGAGAAGRLVATVLAIGAISAVGISSASTAQAAPTPSPTAHPVATAQATPGTTTQHVPHTDTVTAGDTLWGIAQREYHSGEDWPRIFHANQGAPQAGGHLDDPDLIQPGLRLIIPGKTDTVTVKIATTPGTPPPAASRPAPQVSPTHSTASAPDETAGARSTGQESTRAGSGSGTAATDAITTEQPDETNVVRTVAGLGALAAAGVLVLLGTRRARQSRTRRPGQRIHLPAGAAAVAEAQLRVAADPITVADLDVALRALAHAAGPAGLPALRAVRITADGIELYLVDEDATLPRPAEQVADQPGFWSLRRATISSLDPGDADAPYPTLVTLGHDEDEAHLLVNLEELRALAVTGAAAPAVLAALTLELIASSWADDVTVTLVGVLPELAEAIGSDRVTWVPDLEHILAALEYAAGAHATAYAAAGVQEPRQARAAGLHPDTWTPHLVISGAGPSAEQQARLEAILLAVPHVSIAAITTEPLGPWQLRTTGRSSAQLLPPQIELTPQVLDQPDLDALLDAFRAADAAHHDPEPGDQVLADEPDLQDLPDAQLADVWKLLADPRAGEDPEVVVDAARPVVDDDRAVNEQNPPQQSEEDLGPAADQVTDEISTGAERGADSLGDSPTRGPEAADAALEDTTDPVDTPETGPSRPLSAVPAVETALRAPADLLPSDRPVLRLLGPIRVDGLTRRHRSPGTALRILTHLALHPGSSTEDLDQAVWPGQDKTHKTRNPAISSTRTWLGYRPDGRPYLAEWTPDGGYRLDDLTDDWTLFQHLIGDRVDRARTEDLTRALHLVYGKPLTGPRIAEVTTEAEIIATIADVAHHLAARATTTGDHTLAWWAANKGIDVEPASEILWRDLIRAARQSGDLTRLRTTISRYDAQMDTIGGDHDPDTDDLIAQMTQTVNA